jgi:hypothetical protein
LFHEAEQWGNFKDESLQGYGGSKFEEYRDKANDIFIAIPFVTGLIRKPRPVSGRGVPTSGTSSRPPENVNAARFYDRGGGCFDGNAIAALQNGEKRVRDLRKGDVLKDGGVVECVVETLLRGPTAAVIVNGVAFTPYHPIEIAGEWVFPRDIGEIVGIRIESWFNLVVRGDKVVEINGIRAITLGHGREEGVLKHPYFGTEAVVQALRRYEGYNSGRLQILHPEKCERNSDGMIVGIF